MQMGRADTRVTLLVVVIFFNVKVTQPCPTLCDPMDCIVHGILQARILEWVTVPFSRGSFQPRDWTQVSRIAGRFFTSWATRVIFLEICKNDCKKNALRKWKTNTVTKIAQRPVLRRWFYQCFETGVDRFSLAVQFRAIPPLCSLHSEECLCPCWFTCFVTSAAQ